MWIVTDANGQLEAINLGKADKLYAVQEVLLPGETEHAWLIKAVFYGDTEITVSRCVNQSEADGRIYGYAEALDESARKARTE